MNHPLSGRQGKALAACYFNYFALVGLLVPYLGAYLHDLGFDSLAIGQLMSILFFTRLVAPNLWAYIADRMGKRLRFVQLGSLLATLIFAATLQWQDFSSLAIIMFSFTFFWNGVLPQLEVLTLASLGDQSHRYGTIRSFGSAGYIVLVLSVGVWFDLHGTGSLPLIGLGVFTLLTLSSLLVREVAVSVEPSGDSSEFLKVLATPSMVLFLIASVLLQASHSAFYTFFVLYLTELGIGETIAGIIVAGGVVLEIGIFAIAPRLLGRYALPNLLLLVALFTALRWGLTPVVGASEWGQLAIQGLHCISFGLGHACAIQFIHQRFPVADQGKAQALYASLAFGLGGAAGAWMSGLTWKDGAGAELTWYSSAAMAAVAMLVLLLFKQRQMRAPQRAVV